MYFKKITNNFQDTVFLLLFLFCIVFPLNTMFYAKDIDITVNIVPRATYFIDEIYDMIVDQTNLYSLGSVVLTNTTQEEVSLRARIRMYSNLISPNDPLVDYITSETAYPIVISPGGSFVISQDDITKDKLEGGTLSGSIQDIEDKAEAVYGSDVLLKTGGMLPEDRYSFQIDVYAASDTALTTILGSAQESYFVPLEYGYIDVIAPENGVVLSGENQYPQFVWTPLNVRDNVGVIYKISIWKAESTDIEAVIETSPILIEETSDTQFLYPASALPLIYNQQYVWQVTALDESNSKIGIASYSDPSMFKFGEMVLPEILDDVQTLDAFPVQVFWTSQLTNYNQRIVVSEFPDLSSPIINETVEGSQFTINKSRYIYGNKRYYWQIVVSISDNDFLYSNIGSFQVNQSINLIYPLDDTIHSNTISCYWDGHEASLYKLLVGTTPALTSAITYQVEGQSSIINRQDLQPNETTFYWQVVELDQYGNELMKSNNIGKFKLPILEAPTLYFPINESVDNIVSFSFEPVEWADTFVIELFDTTKQQLIWSTDTNNPTYTLQLESISELQKNETYFWQVTAKSSVLNKQLSSDYGSFFYKGLQEIDIINSGIVNNVSDLLWKPVKEAISYDIFVSEDVQFSNPKIINSFQTQVALDQLKSDDNSIYVKIQGYNTNGTNIAVSGIEKIEFEDIQALDSSIQLSSPLGTIQEENSQVGESLLFSWYPNIEKGKLVISNQQSLLNATFFDISGTMFINNTLKKDLLFKTTYFYKIINTENNQESETGQFRIIPAPINVLAPPQETQVANATTLQWTTPLKGPYIVILSQDESFKVSEKYITTDLFYEYEPTNSGKWYWMIKILDEENKLVSQSNVFSFQATITNQNVINLDQLDYFLKQNMSQSSILQQDNWTLTSLQPLDDATINQSDINYLVENKDSLIRIIE